MIIQSEAREGKNDISFTVSEADVKKAMATLDPVKQSLRAKDLIHEPGVAKIAVVGVGMKSHPGVAARMFKVLADHAINIQMISTSEIKIACVISRSKLEEAVKVLHAAFELDKAKGAHK